MLGYTAFQTGLVLLAVAVGSFAAIGRHRSPVYIVRLGIVLEIVDIAGIALLLRPDSQWWLTAPLLFGFGLGVGIATAQLTGVVLADVPVQRSGQGSGTQSTARQVGSAFGIAILGTILFTVLGARLDSQLADEGMAEQTRTQLVQAVRRSAGASIPALAADPATAPVAADARSAFTDATRASAAVAALFLLLGLLGSLSLGSGRLPSGSDESAF